MNFFKKPEWKLFYPIYVGLGVGVAIPDIDMLVVVYFLSKGFSATQIGIGLAIQSLMLLISEVPTGAFADLFGKRKSVQVSWIMQAIIFGLFFFVTNYWVMWLLLGLKGIAYTFSTGAFDALPYEIAKNEKKEYLISKFYSTYEFVYQFATGLSNLNVILFLYLIGATKKYTFLGQAHQGMDFLWLTGCVGYFAGAAILSKLKEKIIKRNVNLKRNIKESYILTKKAFKYSYNHPIISRLVLVGIFTEISALFFSDVVYQPFLIKLGFRVEYLAVLVGVASIVAAFFSFIPKYVINKFNSEKKYLEIFLFAKITVLVSMFFISGPVYGAIFFLAYFGFDSLINPVLIPFKQYFYQKDMRATLGSVESVVKNIASVFFYPFIGYCVDRYGVNSTITFGLLPMIFGFILFKGIKQSVRLQH